MCKLRMKTNKSNNKKLGKIGAEMVKKNSILNLVIWEVVER